MITYFVSPLCVEVVPTEQETLIPGESFRFCLPVHHGLPLRVQGLNNVDSEGRVLGLSVEGKLVLGFAVRNLVNLEPLHSGGQKS